MTRRYAQLSKRNRMFHLYFEPRGFGKHNSPGFLSILYFMFCKKFQWHDFYIGQMVHTCSLLTCIIHILQRPKCNSPLRYRKSCSFAMDVKYTHTHTYKLLHESMEHQVLEQVHQQALRTFVIAENYSSCMLNT